MALVTSKTVMHISGLDALQRAIAQQLELCRALVSDVVAKTTFAVERRMALSAPAKTGNLKRNISSRSSGLTGRVEIGADAWYWHFVEYGTRKMAAQPFARPAAEMESPIMEQRLRDVARKLEAAFHTGSAVQLGRVA